jgi:hypothetical protein
MTLANITNVSEDAKHLDDFLQELLTRIENVYESYSMPIPARRYYTFGPPAIDCEQLVVSVFQMYLGAPGDQATEPRRCHDPRTVTLNITVSREVPVALPNGNPPTAESISDATRVSAYDAWILMDSVNILDVWSEAGSFGLGIISTIDFTPPEGGFQSVTMSVTMAVP